MELISCILCLILSAIMGRLSTLADRGGLTSKKNFFNSILFMVSSWAWLLCIVWFFLEYDWMIGTGSIIVAFIIPMFFPRITEANSFLYHKSNLMNLIVTILLLLSWNKYFMNLV
jgi:hypothetical protein